MIQVVCPRCHHTLQVSPVDIGTTGVCSKCRGHIAILDAIQPMPRSEVPPAALASDAGPTALTDIERRVMKRPTTVLPNGSKGDPLHYELLVRILVDLNQLNSLIRFLRADIPDKPEYDKEREERKRWHEQMGTFGEALVESNMKWRSDNVRDALKRIPDAQFVQSILRLAQGFEDPALLTSADMIKATELAKAKLRGLGDNATTTAFGAQQSA